MRKPSSSDGALPDRQRGLAVSSSPTLWRSQRSRNSAQWVRNHGFSQLCDKEIKGRMHSIKRARPYRRTRQSLKD
jgi:hypothetical protein